MSRQRWQPGNVSASTRLASTRLPSTCPAARGGGSVARMRRLGVVLGLLLLTVGCYYQQPLPHQPSYRPATWEPVLGVVTTDGEEVMFDTPALLESGRVVGRVGGDRVVVPPQDVSRLLVGRKTLDKPKTIVFAAVLITAFTVFFASIGLN